MQLYTIWSSLYDKAMRLTTTSADISYLEHWFACHLERWADSELRMLGEWKDLTQPKQRVSTAFAQLVAA